MGLHALMSACVWFCANPCDPTTTVNTEQSHYKDSFYIPSIIITNSLSFSLPNADNHQSVLHLCDFVISSMLYKWNHIAVTF